MAAKTPNLAHYRDNFMAFAADLHVPLGSGAGRLGDHWADFQKTDFEAMAPSLEAKVRGEMPKLRRFYRERTKGASKDSDCTIAFLYLMLFSPNALRIQIGAFDAAQAGECKLITQQILDIDSPLNRVLAKVIQVQKERIIAHADAKGRSASIAEILTSDPYGAHGARADLLWVNELSHCTNRQFIETCFDNADKRPDCLVFLATNSGEAGSWQESYKEIAVTSPDRWHASIIDYPAPWICEADLEESRKRNPPARFNRLWRGIWSTGEGDGLDMAKVQAATTLLGPARRNSRWLFIAGVDLGIRRDHSAVAILAVDPDEQVVRLADIQSWAPQDFEAGEVDHSTVEASIHESHLRYGLAVTIYDPYQATLLAQRLALRGLAVVDYPFTPQNKDAMAKALIEAIDNRQLLLYPDAALARDLARIRVKENSYGGLRLDSVRDKDGHADRAIALSIALPTALEIARVGIETHSGDDRAEILVP